MQKVGMKIMGESPVLGMNTWRRETFLLFLSAGYLVNIANFTAQ